MTKVRSITAIFCMLVIGATWILAVPQKQGDESEQIKALKKKIKALEQKIELLEKRLKEAIAGTIAIPKTYSDLKKLPKDWKKFDYNGITYFIIPLDQDSGKSKRKIK